MGDLLGDTMASPPPAAPAAVPSGGLDDLLGGDIAPSPAAPSGGLDDLLGGGGMAPIMGGGSSDLMGGGDEIQAGDPNPPSADKIKQWFNALLVSPEGMLYQDGLVTISAKTISQGSQAQVQLIYTNRSDSPLERINVIPSPGSVQLQPGGLPSSIPAGQQAPQSINAVAAEPFQDAPRIKIQFTHNGRGHTVQIKLPLSPNKFFSPVQLQAAQFFNFWKQYQNAPLEFVKQFKARSRVDPAEATNVLSRLGFGICAGVDKGTNVVAAAKLHTSMGDVPCMLRLESSAATQEYRLTVHTAHGSATAGCKNVVLAQLAQE
jgi:AP-2 complex subunit alpha